MSETTEDMNEGVKIVLERLKEFPEDFVPPLFTREAYLTVGRPSRWRELAEAAMNEKEIFTEEERKVVRDAMREAMRKHFSAQVLELLSGRDYSRQETIYEYQEKMRFDSSGNLGIGTGVINGAISNSTINSTINPPDRYRFFK